MKLTANLHLWKSKKAASFYFRSIIDEEKIESLDGIQTVIRCVDFIPEIKFVAKLQIKKRNSTKIYSFHIPPRLLPRFIGKDLRLVYNLILKPL